MSPPASSQPTPNFTLLDTAMNCKPRALYIHRDYFQSPFPHGLIGYWRHRAFYHGQDGYFEQALDAAYEVIECSARRFLRQEMWRRRDVDVLVVNHLCVAQYEQLRPLVEHAHMPRVLFLGSARAGRVPKDDVLDVFDLVFRRERFKDVDRYKVADHNKRKLHTTMLPCPLPPPLRPGWMRPMLAPFMPTIPPPTDRKQYDVGFAGAVVPNNTIRHDVWARIKSEPFTTCGGLQKKYAQAKPIPPDLMCKRLGARAYMRAIRDARINLALDGYGEFTYRHLELWRMGEFMISSPSIREVKLPLPAEEDVHYVSYDDLDQLVEKVHYYLAHDAERRRIAQAGRELFEQHYDPATHGRHIRSLVDDVNRGTTPPA